MIDTDIKTKTENKNYVRLSSKLTLEEILSNTMSRAKFEHLRMTLSLNNKAAVGI